MLGSETFMFGMIERFNRQVFAIQRFGAGGRGKVLDIILRLGLSGKPAEPIFGHARRRMPESQLDRAPRAAWRAAPVHGGIGDNSASDP